jgi:hypothetical protein
MPRRSMTSMVSFMAIVPYLIVAALDESGFSRDGAAPWRRWQRGGPLTPAFRGPPPQRKSSTTAC